MQTYSSKMTSINTSKLPKVFSHLNYASIPEDFTIFDYGCGRYTQHIQDKVESNNLNYIPYDKFWSSDEQKNFCSPYLDKDKIKNTGIFVCSNVLNVINDEQTIKEIIEITKSYRSFVFSIYEGDKTGIGKSLLERDCYQRNERVKQYMRFFKDTPLTCVYKGFITNNKNIIF